MFVIKNRTGTLGLKPLFISKDNTIKGTLIDDSVFMTNFADKAKKFVTSNRARQWLKIVKCNNDAFQIVTIECANAHVRMAA